MLNELSQKAISEVSKYADDYEIYISQSKGIELNAEKTELNFAKEEINIGVGISILKDNKLGHAYTSNVNEIAKTAKQAYFNSKINEEDKNFSFAPNSKFKSVKGLYDKRIDDISLDDGTEYMKGIFDVVSDEKCQVSSGGFSVIKGESLIVNSNGLNAYDKSTGFGGYVAVNITDNGELSNAYDGESSCTFNLDGEKLAENVCKLAKDSLHGEAIETKDMPVILDYHAAAGLLNNFLNGINGDNVLRGRSILADKIGKEIVSPNLSIYDDNTYEGSLLSGICDGEGTPSQKTVIVDNGLLKNFIFDIYNANKGNTQSTSNGFRGSYAGIPSVGTSNVIFDFDETEDISEIDNGIIVNNVLGAHTANPISGDFSVEASNVFKIENGEITKPVKKAMISGNIYDCLKNCIGMSSDIRQLGSFVIPKIGVSSLRVIGQ